MTHPAAPEPDLAIIDPHHHLWDFPGRTYLVPEMMRNLRAGHDIRATVFVQCGAMLRADGPAELKTLGETEFANGVAATFASSLYGDVRPCHRIVAQVDLTLGAQAGPVLDRHCAAAGERLVGIRHITAWNADAQLLNPRNIVWPGMMGDAKFRAGFAELARRDLVFDAWLLHPQIPELVDLARAFPTTTIILDHLGGPVRPGFYTSADNAVFNEWRTNLAALATCPNVLLKIGGLGMPMFGFDFHTRTRPASVEELAAAWKPYIFEAIALFGAGRCMFESNFPVDAVSCGFFELWAAFRHVMQEASVEDRQNLFHDTAARAYRFAT